VPIGVETNLVTKVDDLRYQELRKTLAGNSNEIMTIKLRYKEPDGNVSMLITHPVIDEHTPLLSTSDNFRFSASVAEFGLLLRQSAYKQDASYEQVIQLGKSAKGNDEDGYRQEFVRMVEIATSLVKR
jgi:Ca-activated chloride channel homolog